VPDFTEPGAFDTAVDGVDAIVHVASPLIPEEDGVEPSKLIDPAVKGTIGVLESAHKNGKKVKRVVITSSVVTILEPHTGNYTYTEVSLKVSFAIHTVSIYHLTCIMTFY
jgi:nucleoside-diphosphate-sugar epimerase